MLSEEQSFKAWAAEYYKREAQGTNCLWPNETLIRMFKGPYIPGIDKDFAGKSVLDVSCGTGNNLIFLKSLGLRLFGTEVDPQIIDLIRESLSSSGIDVDLRLGTNRSLPFDTNQFDYLVSWNVIHYEHNEADMIAAIAEYQRVLKPGGRIFIMTAGPDHKILKNATTLGNHRFEIGREGEFRKGQVFFYFDSPRYIHQYFDPKFADVRVGRTNDDMFTDVLDFFIITGVKP